MSYMVDGSPPDHHLVWPYANNAGENKGSPFNIVALLLARTIGDFSDQCVFAASFKQLFNFANLFIYWRDDRPYKSQLVSMMPNVTYSWSVKNEDSLPLDAFDCAGQRPVKVSALPWYQMGCDQPDIVLTPSMMQRTMLPSFPSIAHLRYPSDRVKDCDNRLAALGIDPDRWFCVVHYREPNYKFRAPNEARDLDVSQVNDVIRFIVEDLEGQVVRIGHKGMSPLLRNPGFIDLAGVEDGFQTHAHAISRARFFIELSPSGPVCVAWGMGVPVARCNCVSLYGPLDEQSIVLPKRIRRPNGRLMNLKEVIAERAINDNTMSRFLSPLGYRFEPNTFNEIVSVCRQIFDVTMDCPGWRSQISFEKIIPNNSVTWPMEHKYRHQIADYIGI